MEAAVHGAGSSERKESANEKNNASDRGPGLIAVCVLGFFGYRAARKYIPTKEMADLKSLYGVSGEDTAILYNQELQEARGLYMNGQTYLPISWVNEHINNRSTGTVRKICWSTPCRTRSFMPMGKPRGPRGKRSF